MSDINSLKNLKSILQDIASRSFALKGSFGYGRTYDYGMSEKDISYPVIWVTPVSAVMNKSDANSRYVTVDYTFNIKCLDRVRKDMVNSVDVESDTFTLLMQVVTELNDHPYYTRSDMSMVGNINFTPLEGWSNDQVSGHECQMTFRMLNKNTFCGLPFEPIPGVSFPGPEFTGFTYSPQFLTCASVTACTTLQNYLDQNFVNIDGDTMTGPLVINAGASGFTYVDGNQGAGKVLVTDAYGNASWDNPPAYSLSQFMFISGASSISGYHQAIPLSQYSASTLVSYSTGLTTTARVMGIFATNAGQPNTTVIPAGNFTFNFDTQKASGSIAYFTHAELYKRNTGGTETFLLSSETSSVSILNTNISNSLNGVSSSIINLDVSDRLVVKIYGRTSSSTATVSLRIDGTTNAGLIMPVNAASSADFVPYINASDDVDLGSFTITAGAFYGNGSGLTGIDHTAVQPGSNITTGGTASAPIISTVASPSFNNLTLSGTGIASAFSATTLSANTYYSGSTPLTTIINNIAASYSGTSSGGGFSGWTASTGLHSIIANNGSGNAAGNFSIVGGQGNTANGNYSHVGGGYGNNVPNSYSVIGGGSYNQLSGNHGIIGGGQYNYISNSFNGILGGFLNKVYSSFSVIGGGRNNTINQFAAASSILGGTANTISQNLSAIAAGRNNTILSGLTFIGAGRNNQAQNTYGFIGAGRYNRTGYMSAVAGGNTNYATGNESFIGGGRTNTASGTFSIIAGGVSNIASYSNATIVGGNSNRATASASIAGGLRNAASGHYSVAFGFQNSATTTYSAVIGGNTNIATASGAIVIGGNGINGSNANTVHIPYLNIQSADTNASVSSVLVKDTNGQVYIRDASTIGTAGNFLPLSGGTVSGDTKFTTVLSATTFITDTVTGTTTSGLTIDWASASNFDYTLSANTTISFSNDKNGQQIIAAIRQDSTGGFTLTWPASVMWPNGVEPTQTSGASTFDLYTLIKFNNQYIGSYIQDLS